MKLKTFTIFLLAFNLLSHSTTSLAEGVRYYDFEVIFFETLSQEGKISETWKNDVVLEPPKTFVTLGQPYPGLMPKEYDPNSTFKFLPQKSYRLLEEAKLLEANSNYRILLHTAWRQPGMPEETTIPIHFHNEYIETTKIPTTNTATDPDMPAVNLPTPRSTSMQTKSVLDGYLKIILSRYLHADFDFVYKKGLPYTSETTIITSSSQANNDTADTALTTGPVVASYTLKQTRKMRSKEVHYIDHPVVGVIILAWPVENND